MIKHIMRLQIEKNAHDKSRFAAKKLTQILTLKIPSKALKVITNCLHCEQLVLRILLRYKREPLWIQ